MISLFSRHLTPINRVQLYLKYSMSNKQRKISQVGFKTQNIINTNELTYITKDKLQFKNGKTLIYKSKKGLLTTLKRYLSYHTSISAIAYLLYTNPFKAVFPAAIPILWIVQLILIKMMFKRYQWNQTIADEIYLLESGSTTQVHFADKTRRKLFGQHQSTAYYNTIFADPIQKEKEQVMPNSNPFPKNQDDFQKQSLGWAWCKYYSNGENYIILPKQYEVMKKDVLIQLFKGKTIKNH